MYYSDQHRRLQQILVEKRTLTGKGKRDVILVHNNARSRAAVCTRQILLELG